MRPIDADALIKWINESRCADCPDKPEERCGACQWDDVIMSIETAPTIATDTNVLGKWISVKDRLPGVCEDALVYIERDAWGNSNTPHRKRCIDIGCHVENGSWNIPNCGKKTLVLAWMPLPEPPKEVTGDD